MLFKIHATLVALASVLHVCIAVDQAPPIDLFGKGNIDWYLAFRGTAFVQQSVYDAYLRGSNNVDLACKQTIDTNLPCLSHYRSPILDDWKAIDEVAFVIYKDGTIQQYAIFNGAGTDNQNWFNLEKLTSSSWSDLKGQTSHHYFSIDGDASLKRRFFIDHNYGGCASDAGWFVAVDQGSTTPCQWEKDEGYPVFMYSTSRTYENWTTGKFAKADVIAVYVKYREPEILPFVDLFATGKTEWRLVFRGTSHINEPVYNAYLHGSEKVDAACKQPNGDIPCNAHYRSSILDDWKDIAEVAFVIYKSGNIQKYALFDGLGTDNMNWFSDTQLRTSSWSDLQGKQQYFSIQGDDGLKRRFFIHHNYGGCDHDVGWFVAKDQSNKPCGWESVKTYPLFLYSTSNSSENLSTGKVAEADVIAVYVKFGSPNPAVG